jgi:hypothetical protein
MIICTYIVALVILAVGGSLPHDSWKGALLIVAALAAAVVLALAP